MSNTHVSQAASAIENAIRNTARDHFDITEPLAFTGTVLSADDYLGTVELLGSTKPPVKFQVVRVTQGAEEFNLHVERLDEAVVSTGAIGFVLGKLYPAQHINYENALCELVRAL
jgi:hypothetical protein